MNLMRNASVATAVLLLVGCSSMGAHNEQSQQEAMNDEVTLTQRAADVVNNQMTRPPQKRIPSGLIDGAKCIAVFPSVVQAGLIVGGKHGRGVVTCRDQSTGQWNDMAPVFYSLSGGSVGLQAGAQSTSVILLFLDQNGVNRLLNSNVTLGSDISIAAGPVGYNAGIRGAPASVVSYTTDSKGLFAGINLSGAKLSFDQDANQDVYPDQEVDPRTLLLKPHQVPTGMAAYNQSLQQLGPASSQRNLTNTGTSTQSGSY